MVRQGVPRSRDRNAGIRGFPELDDGRASVLVTRWQLMHMSASGSAERDRAA